MSKVLEAPPERPLEDGAADSPARAINLPQPLAVDSSKAVCNYANFCRVTGAEEVVLDLGLNENPMGAPTAAIVVTQRVVFNYYTAKRLLQALNITIQRHEAAFGVIETDVQKRLAPRPRG